MITAIRRSFQSNAYKLILWITIFALAGVFSLPQLLKEFSSSNSWILKINKREVPFSDYLFKVQAQEVRIQMLRQHYGQLADMLLQSLGALADPKVFALENLIKDELLHGVALAQHIRISPIFIAEKLASPVFVQQELSDLIPMYLIDPYTGINIQALRSYLQRFHVSMKEFEDKVDKVLARRIIMDMLGGALYVPEFVMRELYINQHLAKKFSLLHFNFADYVAKAKTLSATTEQLTEFYNEQNKLAKRYWMPEQRAGKVWEFGPEAYGLVVDADAIESYYNSHKKTDFLETPMQVQIRRILLKADKNADIAALQEKAQLIRQELLKNPAQFAVRAQEVSQDTESAKQGGLLPFFSQGTHHKVLDRAAFLLQNDGDISDILVSDDGVEIIQRVARKAAIYKPLSAVKKNIEKILVDQKFKKQFAHDAQRYVQLSREKNVTENTADPMIKYRSKPLTLDMADKQDTPRSQALFSIKQEGGYAFYLDGDKGYLVEATRIKDRYLPTLDAIRNEVEQDWQEIQAKKLLEQDIQKAREMARATNFAELKNIFKAAIEHTGLVKKSDAESLKQLEKKGFPVEQMLALTAVGSIGQAKVDLDGYLIRLEEVEPFNESEFSQLQKEIRKQAQAEEARMLAEGFVASLGRNATITINESLLKSGK